MELDLLLPQQRWSLPEESDANIVTLSAYLAAMTNDDNRLATGYSVCIDYLLTSFGSKENKLLQTFSDYRQRWKISWR